MMTGRTKSHRTDLRIVALFAVAATLLLAPISRAADDSANAHGTQSSGEISRDVPRPRIGQILVAGNTTLPPCAILDHLPLNPGDPFEPEDLRTAERALTQSPLFEIGGVDDPSPSVTIVAGDEKSVYQDVLISVREKPHAPLRWRLLLTLRTAATACVYGLPAGIAQALAE